MFYSAFAFDDFVHHFFSLQHLGSFSPSAPSHSLFLVPLLLFSRVLLSLHLSPPLPLSHLAPLPIFLNFSLLYFPYSFCPYPIRRPSSSSSSWASPCPACFLQFLVPPFKHKNYMIWEKNFCKTPQNQSKHYSQYSIPSLVLFFHHDSSRCLHTNRNESISIITIRCIIVIAIRVISNAISLYNKKCTQLFSRTIVLWVICCNIL